MPRFTDSVPPEVRTTSTGSASSARAMASRASSSTRLASWPCEWMEDGLPTRVSAPASAAIASGRMGVVAAWSR